MKQKIHKLSIALGIVGIFIITASTIRWFFLFPDMSQFILAVGIGVVVVGFGYIHETIKRIDGKIGEFDTALDASIICYRDEIDKLNKRIDNMKLSTIDNGQ